MASSWESLEETHQLDKLTLRDGMQQMLQYERDTRQNNRIQRLINFEQIIDDRYNRKATILASQLPTSDWYNVFYSELIAEACLDRIVHKAMKFTLSGESLRKKY